MLLLAKTELKESGLSCQPTKPSAWFVALTNKLWLNPIDS